MTHIGDKQRYILLEDITSNYKDRKGKPIVYGSKTDIVTIVADHGNVQIVQDKKGNRFPVSIKKLREL